MSPPLFVLVKSQRAFEQRPGDVVGRLGVGTEGRPGREWPATDGPAHGDEDLSLRNRAPIRPRR